jgi:hypothetical protein
MKNITPFHIFEMSKISHDENYENLVKEKIVDIYKSLKCRNIIHDYINDCTDIIEKKLDIKLNRYETIRYETNTYPFTTHDISITPFISASIKDITKELNTLEMDSDDDVEAELFYFSIHFSETSITSVEIVMNINYSTIRINDEMSRDIHKTTLDTLSTKILIDNTTEQFLTILLSRIKDDIIKIMINK